MELRKVFFDNINIKPVDDNVNNIFLWLIERLITNKKDGVETFDIEKEIECKIYQIYDINIDEQQSIEKANV
jgi:hypothetical protein